MCVGGGVCKFLCTCVGVCDSRFSRGDYLISLQVSSRFLTSLSDDDAVMLSRTFFSLEI